MSSECRASGRSGAAFDTCATHGGHINVARSRCDRAALAAPTEPTLDVERVRDILDSMPGLYGGITTADGSLHPDFTLGIAEYLAARLASQVREQE